MDPIIMFFVLGLIAGLLKSPVYLPKSVYEFLSSYLLLAIGIKGGVELYKHSFLDLAPQILAVGIAYLQGIDESFESYMPLL